MSDKKRQSDRKTYDEATRLTFGLVGKRDNALGAFVLNTQAQNIAKLQSIGDGFLTQENNEWLQAYLTNVGRAQYLSILDPLSQAALLLATEKAPEPTKNIQPTPLDDLSL